MNRKSLSDILREGDRQNLSRAWGETQAAEDFTPLPSGEYVARIIGGELFTSKSKGTAGYKLAFRVLEGDHQGRQFWHDVWLTPAAKPDEGEGIDGAGSAPGEPQDGKTPKRKRGRPADTNPKRDKQVYDAWKTGQHRTQADCDRELGLPVGTTYAACERHRKRLERRNKRRRTK